ncbi:MAG: YdeI/OmpD-associated family protein [Planctomycetota bacterium]|jgi:uncharacterized protein YdeI (YjbR/CyaY-like superfamily)
MKTTDALYFETRQEWRHWLTINHAATNEAWLVHYKKYVNKVGISYDDALEEALCFGWIDGKMHSIDEEKYKIRYSPRMGRSVWSKLNKEKAEKLIRAGKMTIAGLSKIEETKKNGYWDIAYTNRKTEELPLDLRDMLIQDKSAWYNFQRFANSYRNNYIGWINKAKSEETRKRRIWEVVGRSSINKKPGVE